MPGQYSDKLGGLPENGILFCSRRVCREFVGDILEDCAIGRSLVEFLLHSLDCIAVEEHLSRGKLAILNTCRRWFEIHRYFPWIRESERQYINQHMTDVALHELHDGP
jgi:hypothetical protein